ncbi:unnamed protein product [Parajaminaea phylloscopi]
MATPTSGPVLGISKPRPKSSTLTSYFPSRTKMPFRARKIVATMDAGLEKARASATPAAAAAAVKGVTQKCGEQAPTPMLCESKGKGRDLGVSVAGKEDTADITLVGDETKFTPTSHRRTSPSDGVEAGECSKSADVGEHGASESSANAERDTKRALSPSHKPGQASKKPRQSYLAKIQSNQTLGSNDDDGDRQSCRESAPPVPLFSTASKRQLNALTSKGSLRDSRNPITHSAVGRGTMHYQSASTGHQVANRVTAAGPAPDGWWATRTRKIRHQLKVDAKDNPDQDSSAPATLFRGCNVYINGYTGVGVGNKELARILTMYGAEVHMLPVGSTTHIVSSMQLSAKKRQEMIQIKASRVKKFVKVEWVLDSVEAGKRKPEHLYSHGTETQRGIADMLGGAVAKGNPSSATRSPFLPSKTPTPLGTASPPRPSPAASLISGDWRLLARQEAARREATEIRGCSN